MKKSVLSIVLLTICLCSWGRGDINYEHKAINKTLIKSCKLVNPNLSEVSIPKELATGVEGKFFSISSDNTDSEITYMYIGRVNSCRAGGCSMPITTEGAGNSEYFDYMVLFNKQYEVALVKIFNYQATHGHEVTAKGWLKQFIGYDIESNDLEVGKNIDSISGATISVNGITQDVTAKTRLLNKFLGQS